MSAIKLKVKKAVGDYDFGGSRFLGFPVLPDEILDNLPQTALFLLQINLEEIKDLDKGNMLPHKGYLYFFLDTEEGIYDLKPIVKYYDGEPVNVIDDFNSIVPDFEQFVEPYLVDFELTDDSATGNKLLGVPADWNYQDEPNKLLFQFDPLDSDMGLLDSMDGLLYFFFADDKDDFDNVNLMEEYS